MEQGIRSRAGRDRESALGQLRDSLIDRQAGMFQSLSGDQQRAIDAFTQGRLGARTQMLGQGLSAQQGLEGQGLAGQINQASQGFGAQANLAGQGLGALAQGQSQLTGADIGMTQKALTFGLHSHLSSQLF